MGLDVQIAFNRGIALAAPAGVTKAAGLRAALDALRLSPHNVVSVGNAVNDHGLLALAELGVAVANAVDDLKLHADYVTREAAAAGALEIVNALVDDDLTAVTARIEPDMLAAGNHHAAP